MILDGARQILGSLFITEQEEPTHPLTYNFEDFLTVSTYFWRPLAALMEVPRPKTSSKCPCLAWPGPVEMLKTAGHGQGKTDTGNSEQIDLFGKLPFYILYF